MPKATQVPLPSLGVPDTLLPRVVAAVRGTYPTLTAGVPADSDAVKTVLRYWLTTTLAQWEALQASTPEDTDAAVDALRDAHQKKRDAAAAQAAADAAAIT